MRLFLFTCCQTTRALLVSTSPIVRSEFLWVSWTPSLHWLVAAMVAAGLKSRTMHLATSCDMRSSFPPALPCLVAVLVAARLAASSSMASLVVCLLAVGEAVGLACLVAASSAFCRPEDRAGKPH
ncbi:uncharacterized protein J3D65DRAFT_631625 [Phyllosticta citribraziliensis]|uniref:Uncharacterized protein n=1 Tax=Phyllosticta citribraziliensis TaxID=989973 RepID=A0ABR1LF84_9PEZI